jgi:hypothetical protein
MLILRDAVYISDPAAECSCGFSGFSVMVASVSISTLATDTAFSRARPHDSNRIDDARLQQIHELLTGSVEADAAPRQILRAGRT